MTFPNLSQVFPNQKTFDNYCAALDVGPYHDSIYAHMMIRFGESTLRYSSQDQAAMKVIRILDLQYDVWLQKKEALDELRDQDLEAYKEMSMQIGNMAANPNTEPEEEIIPYVSQQQTIYVKRGKVDAILSKYRAALAGHTERLLNELQFLFKGIHAESEDVFIYE